MVSDVRDFLEDVLFAIGDIFFYTIIAVFLVSCVLIAQNLYTDYTPHVNPENYAKNVDYGILSDSQVKTFDDILDAINNDKSVVSCPKFSKTEQYEISTQLGLYFGNIENITSLIYWGNNTASLNSDMIKQRLLEKTIIDARIDEAISTFIEGSDRFKLWQISNYISKKITYSINHRNVIDALNGSGVCSSYSILFYKMASRIGIKTYICCGYASEAYHAWNMVELDGSRLYYDVTWYDGVARNIKYIHNKNPWGRDLQVNNIIWSKT